MQDAVLRHVFAAHGGRFAGDGVPQSDLDAIIARLRYWNDWFDVWAEQGDAYEERALAALEKGADVTAGEFLWYASIFYQYAQFLWFHQPQKREAGQRRKQELYRQAAPLLFPLARRFDLAIDGLSIPGYVRTPPGQGPFPCVILLGGLESTKEESYMFEQMCLRRGLATCTFDGPGQGEMFFQRGYTPDIDKYCSRVIDHLDTVREIDSGRIGILGRSLGGYLAVQCAAFDPRIKACVCWGAFFDLSWWDKIPELTRTGFLYITKMEDKKNAKAYLLENINLNGIAEKMTCPLYVLHGGKDTVIPGDQTDRLEKATSRIKNRTFNTVPNGNHCCHNYSPVVRPQMADWLLSSL